MTFQLEGFLSGTVAARQRGAAPTTEPGPGGSGPAALLPGTVVASSRELEANTPAPKVFDYQQTTCSKVEKPKP